MSQLCSQKAQLTKAANSLRKKIAEVDQANLDLVDFASEASKDPHLVFNRLNSFSLSFSSISRAASALRGQLEKAEEFARQNPDERGEFPFLSDIHAHWETDSAPSPQHAHQAEVAVHSHSPSRPSDPTAPVDQRPPASHTGAHPSGGFGFPSGNPPSNPIHFSQSPFGLPNSLPNPFSRDLQASSSSSLNPFLPLEQPVKLPSYEIPTFSGDIEAFSEFWDIFSTAVHNNNTVPAAVKFMYLKSVLEGDAARIIAGFKPTAKDYDTAVRTILSTYDRPEILRSRLWDKLSQQSPASDSAISQRATLCALQATWYQMKELNEDSSSIATLRTIRSKFPWRTREKVGELKGKSDSMWTVDELLSALSTVIDRLQVVEDSDPAGHRAYNSDSTVRQHSPSPYRYPGTSQPYMRYPSYQQQPAYPRYARSSRSPSPRYRDATYRPPTPYYPRRTSRSPVRPQYTTPWEPRCAFCFRHGHPSECCMTVRDVQQRRELVNQYRLCWLCLEEGHTFNICRAPACRYCGRLHHPALCVTLPSAPYSSYPPAQFRQRTPSPRRVQFETTAHSSPPRTQYASPRTSPSRRPTLKAPSPSRRQSRSNSRRASLPRRSSSAFPAVQTSTCTPVAHDSIQSDEPTELLDQHKASVPRLMVVHAITRNLKTSTDELLTVFLDSGSQYSFICTSLAYHLGLTFKNTRTVTTLTFGGHQFTEDSSEVTLTLWDQLDRPIQLQLWTRHTITTVPKTNNLDETNNTYMDDRVEVDVLIGIDNYWRVVDLHRNEKLPSGLILSHTRFGPVLSGLSYPVVSEITSSATTLLNDDAPGTEQLLRNLLGLDTLGLDDSDEISGFQLRLPRFVGYPSANAYDLVICSDASKRVYAVAVYVVTRTSTYSPSSTLLFAKAKLAPSGAITIPRMELLACHMAAKTVLDGLKSDNIDCGFYYLATDVNPADCATRGLTAVELESHIWWSGPSFITIPFADWPCKSFNASSDPPAGGDSEGLRTTTAVVTSANTIMTPYQSFVPFRRTNSYIRLVRITAYVLKYVAKLRRLVRTRHSADDSDEHPLFGTIDASPTVTPGDFSASELIVIREHYREVPQQLHGFHLKKLRTRQEGDGTIRVDLRMANAETSGTAKSPILILSGHPLCAMLIAHYHQKLFHAGTSHLIAALRERFYIPRLKRMVKSAIAKGAPDIVISDNAPMFKLGREIITNSLKEVAEDSLVDGFVESQNINWTFITPYSPWKGGFYERLVGSVKSCLKKTVRREILDLWLFETLILEIEAVLNTRPLFPANSANSNTDLVIRPIDLINPQFRLGRLTYSMPQKIETSSRDHYESLKTQYRLLQTDLDYFWDIWHKEYLAALAERQATRTQKSSGTKRSPRVGDVVLIKEQDLSKSRWPLGLILQLHTSPDGNVRSARIKIGKRKDSGPCTQSSTAVRDQCSRHKGSSGERSGA
ncbi:unnamed protein product [Cylicocyclus nassatus]|uniref:Integrase catalytic domain-containing protein n=1 Tax=Cylicocyclus nassatus TaxID=53992 RepID=A0AA36DR77_CYLNA|nr:unnamed protein product [Cylicocyclus nassatus]